MKSWIRTPVAFATLAVAVAFGACSGDDDPTGGNEDPPPMAVTVSMEDNFFDEQNVTIQVGGTVTWVYSGDGRAHTTTSNDGIWDSGEMGPGDDPFEWTFDETGTFPYHCIPHRDVGMIGTVTVVEAE